VIFWQFFLATVAIVIGLAVAVAAVVGFAVLGYLGKEAYDERHRTVWRNEPPTGR
jgi:hypothetical protein